MTITFRASGPIDIADQWASATLTMETVDAFALFDFIGLARDDFGSCEARDLAARARRGLWPSRNASGKMRANLQRLLDFAGSTGDLVVFDQDIDAAKK